MASADDAYDKKIECNKDRYVKIIAYIEVKFSEVASCKRNGVDCLCF